MADLEIALGGVKMRNPIGIAQLTAMTPIGHIPQRHADFLMRYVDAGAGYVCVPAVVSERERPKKLDGYKGHVRGAWKVQRAETKGFTKREGLFATACFDMVPNYLDESLELMHKLKAKLPKDVPLIASMDGSSGADGEKYAKLAKILEEAGADMIEINMSCPLPLMGESAHQDIYPTDIPPEVSSWMKSLGLTSTLGDTPAAITPVVKAIVDAVKCPVGPKPSPEIGFPRMVAILKTIANTGAKYAVNISNPLSVAPPDIYNGGKGKYPAFGDLNPLAAVIGPMNRYQAMKCLVAGSLFVPELDYAIAGGIVTPENMVEAMMLGAKQIQISSGLYWEGIKIIPRFISFLENYMDKQGYGRVNDLIGLGLQYIKPVDENTDFCAYKAVARVDFRKCTRCGKCAPNFCFALSRDGQDNPLIHDQECIACGLCAAICSFSAISIENR